METMFALLRKIAVQTRKCADLEAIYGPKHRFIVADLFGDFRIVTEANWPLYLNAHRHMGGHVIAPY